MFRSRPATTSMRTNSGHIDSSLPITAQGAISPRELHGNQRWRSRAGLELKSGTSTFNNSKRTSDAPSRKTRGIFFVFLRNTDPGDFYPFSDDSERFSVTPIALTSISPTFKNGKAIGMQTARQAESFRGWKFDGKGLPASLPHGWVRKRGRANSGSGFSLPRSFPGGKF